MGKVREPVMPDEDYDVEEYAGASVRFVEEDRIISIIFNTKEKRLYYYINDLERVELDYIERIICDIYVEDQTRYNKCLRETVARERQERNISSSPWLR